MRECVGNALERNVQDETYDRDGSSIARIATHLTDCVRVQQKVVPATIFDNIEAWRAAGKVVMRDRDN
jgi:hypothetical protein